MDMEGTQDHSRHPALAVEFPAMMPESGSVPLSGIICASIVDALENRL